MHQIYQVKLTFVPFGGLEFTPNFTSLRKQPTFHDATNSLPAKWRLRNKSRNSTVMAYLRSG